MKPKLKPWRERRDIDPKSSTYKAFVTGWSVGRANGTFYPDGCRKPKSTKGLQKLKLSDAEIGELNDALWRKHGLGMFARVIVKEINQVLAMRPNTPHQRHATPTPDGGAQCPGSSDGKTVCP